jgi:hypothetical protein
VKFSILECSTECSADAVKLGKEVVQTAHQRAPLSALVLFDTGLAELGLRCAPLLAQASLNGLPARFSRSLRRLQSLSVSLSARDFSSNATPSEAAAITLALRATGAFHFLYRP